LISGPALFLKAEQRLDVAALFPPIQVQKTANMAKPPIQVQKTANMAKKKG
jgi:hypothetical protein